MFKTKQSKKKSVNIVNNLLEDFLQVADKSILPKQRKRGVQNASTINKISKDTHSVRELKHIQKKNKLKERKQRNKAINKTSEMNSKVERLSKLQNKDEEIVSLVLNDRINKLKALDGLNDKELVELQREVFQLNKSNLNNYEVHEAALSNRERQERKILKDMKKDEAIVGITPGLAMPGESDDESEDDDGEENNGGGDDDVLRNFKDDFDDYS